MVSGGRLGSAVDVGLAVGDGVAVGCAPGELAPVRQELKSGNRDHDHDHGRGGDRQLGNGIHVCEPPRGPQEPALWRRVDLIEGAQQDSLGVLVSVLVKPRQDDARLGIAFGGHPEASVAADRASASSAARMARIA
jgi:hypothetical protein